MQKKDELADPTSCLNRAADDELLFVLLGRDKAAPAAIRAWCQERVRLGKNEWDDAQIQEALVTVTRIEGQHLRQQRECCIEQGLFQRYFLASAEDAEMAWSGSRWVPHYRGVGVGGVQVSNFPTIEAAAAYAREGGLTVLRAPNPLPEVPQG